MSGFGGRVPIVRQLAFLGLGLAAIYLPLAPIAPASDQVAPDVLYCILIAWVLRDPAAVPLWMVLALGVFADLMLSRPPGLGALGLLLASETARTHREMLRGVPFLVEWLAATAGFALIVTFIVVMLRLSLAVAPNSSLALRLVVETALLYLVVSPAIALGLRIFGPRALRFQALESAR